MSVFLQVNKEYFDDKELKPEDILVLAQITEFNRNGCECYMTNKQFSDMCHVSEKSIERTINRLEKSGYITRSTKAVKGFGNIGRQRTLSIKNSNNRDTDKLAKSKDGDAAKQSISKTRDTVNLSKDTAKNEERYRPDDAIKDNKKENKNINNSKKKNNTSPNGSVTDEYNFKRGYSHVTDYLGIKCSEQEFMDACSKYDNVDYNNVIWFNNLYKDGMNIFEFVDAIKGYLG